MTTRSKAAAESESQTPQSTPETTPEKSAEKLARTTRSAVVNLVKGEKLLFHERLTDVKGEITVKSLWENFRKLLAERNLCDSIPEKASREPSSVALGGGVTLHFALIAESSLQCPTCGRFFADGKSDYCPTCNESGIKVILDYDE